MCKKFGWFYLWKKRVLSSACLITTTKTIIMFINKSPDFFDFISSPILLNHIISLSNFFAVLFARKSNVMLTTDLKMPNAVP